MFKRISRVAMITIALVLFATPAAAYIPPVDAPVVEEFDAPANPYGPGNRGIDYATPPGGRVNSSGDGIVTFAGPVAGQRFVVVSHSDGLRTTYGLLQSVLVHVGQRLLAGDAVGTSGSSLHFGVRVGNEYVDPMGLFTGAHLVPVQSKQEQLLRSLSAATQAWVTAATSNERPVQRVQPVVAVPATQWSEAKNASSTAVPAVGIAVVAAALGLRRRHLRRNG